MRRDYISPKVREKFNIPLKFKSEKDEIKFWQNCDPDKKMKISMEMLAEYCIKKYGYIPRIAPVMKIYDRRNPKKVRIIKLKRRD